MDNNTIQKLLINCVGYEVVKTEVPTMRGSQKHIIQQDREGLYKQRTRTSWEITNLTFCGLPFQKWEEEMVCETRSSWIPSYKYSHLSWATKKEAIAELQEDFIEYNAKYILAFVTSERVWDHERVLGNQLIEQMESFISTNKETTK